MRYRAPWDMEQALRAKSMRDHGVSDGEIARVMGRTPMGVRKALFRYFGQYEKCGVDRYEVGPAIGPTWECKRIKNDAIGGSEALGAAINSLLARMGPMARAICLGNDPQRLPGTERILQTCAVERLAA